ncbi:MAG: 6-phosphogluconolactonase, partial [Acidobacteriota bacterium]
RAVAEPIEHRLENRQTLAETLAAQIADDLRAAVDQRGHASLIVSGGSTPVPLFDALCAQGDVPWAQVWITLADERWVPADHEDSNAHLVHTHLLQGAAADARFVGLYLDGIATPEMAHVKVTEALTVIPRPFDVVVLGMGTDGHTASLFPETQALSAGIDRNNHATCLAVRPRDAPHPRLSLTASALLDSRRRVLHITGDEKWAVYRHACERGPDRVLPIRAILRDDRPTEVWWAP